jgi:hypothetical protein
MAIACLLANDQGLVFVVVLGTARYVPIGGAVVLSFLILVVTRRRCTTLIASIILNDPLVFIFLLFGCTQRTVRHEVLVKNLAA